MSNTRANTAELTTDQVAKILIQPLEETSKFLAAGPRIFDTTGPIHIPKMGGPVAVDWIGESEEIPSKDVAMDEVSLLPSTMKSAKVITRYSNELARASVVALDAALQQRLVKDVADKLDGQFFSASGDGVTAPRGLFAYPGTQTVAVDGALGLDHLIDAWGAALDADANVTSMKWVMTPREFVKLRKIKQGTGSNQYVLTPDPTQDGVFRLFGAPVIVTKRVPDTTETTPTARAALVDFAQIAVARDLAPSVTILRERFADYDEQAIRVVCRLDAAPMNPEAVVKLTGIEV